MYVCRLGLSSSDSLQPVISAIVKGTGVLSLSVRVADGIHRAVKGWVDLFNHRPVGPSAHCSLFCMQHLKPRVVAEGVTYVSTVTGQVGGWRGAA